MKNNKGSLMIKKLSMRSFKKNKGRNIVAILAIVLTTMMFTSLFVITQSMQENMQQLQYKMCPLPNYCNNRKTRKPAFIINYPKC